MPGLLDEFAMRDQLAQAQQGPSLPQRIMQIMQQRARITSQRLGMPYEQALQEEMQRAMQGPRGPGGQIPGMTIQQQRQRMQMPAPFGAPLIPSAGSATRG